MSYLIAIGGKGGVGKTTVAGLIVSRLIARGHEPVLAVDADPNTCLDAVLGVKAKVTVGGVREQARQIAGQGLPAGVSKQQLLELKIAESLVEADCFDLVAMGRPEGPGCYCYANNVLKDVLAQIAAQYPYVVLDNEAGLENLSRRLVSTVNLLVMVTDPSQRGIETLRRLHALAREMDIRYDHLVFIVNRTRHDELPKGVAELGAELGADQVIGLPDDDELARLGEDGGSLLTLPATNPVAQRLDALLEWAVGKG
jgi:CO dehydrogenase maturation factor